MTIEVTAKKVNDAINQGLEQLGVTIDQVTVEILDQGGLLRKAKVRITVDEPQQPVKAENVEKSEDKKADKVEKPEKPAKADKPEKAEKTEKPAKPAAPKADKAEKAEKVEKPAKADAQKSEKPAPKKAAEKPADAAKKEHEQKPRVLRDEDKAAAAKALEFVKQVVEKMGFSDTKVEVGEDPEHINITAPSGDDSLIIGRHGEMLSALSYLAETGARAEKCHVNITVDCNGYRDRRAASLTAMAHRRANECASKHRRIKLEPMERIDRRTIHNALTDDDRVTTASEGKEPHRYIVIYPAK